MIVYEDKYFNISLKNNILKYVITFIDSEVPDINLLYKCRDKLQILFDTISNNNKNFYQVFIMNNINISSVLSFKTCIQIMCDFFRNNEHTIKENLILNVILLDNTIIRSAMDLAFYTYTPIKPVHFIKTNNEIKKYISTYN